MSKEARLEHANQLIQLIARHGRRFFYDQQSDTTARLELDHRGRVWFHDHYSKARVYTHPATFGNRWRGFTHGGTLRNLVEEMRDYVATGRQLPVSILGPQRLSDRSNIWGYEESAMDKVRTEGSKLPIIVGNPEDVFA
ncbi:TPA: hypothetical protein ACP32N_005036 [Pseudomonas aeruginosa]